MPPVAQGTGDLRAWDAVAVGLFSLRFFRLLPPVFSISPAGFLVVRGQENTILLSKMLTPRIFYHRFFGFFPPVFWSSPAASDGLNAAIADCFTLGSASLLSCCAHQFPEAFLLVRGPSGCRLFRRHRCAYVCLNAKHNCGDSLSGDSLQGQGRRAGTVQGTERHPNLKGFFEMLPILAYDSCLLQESVNVAKQPPPSPPKGTPQCLLSLHWHRADVTVSQTKTHVCIFLIASLEQISYSGCEGVWD